MATIQDALAELNAANGAWNRRDAEAVRVRLDLFWKAKAAAWTDDPSVQSALTLMDADAHNIWSRMEESLALMADTGSAEREQHSATAEAAAVKAAALKAQGGASQASVDMAAQRAASLKNLAAKYDQTIVDSTYGAAFKAQAQQVIGASILNVPAWAWIGGAVAVGLLLLSSRN